MMSAVPGTIPAMLEGTEEFSIHSLGSSHQLCLVASHKNAVLQRNPKSFTANRTAQPPKGLSIPKRGKYSYSSSAPHHQLVNCLHLLPSCSSSRIFQAQFHAGQTTSLQWAKLRMRLASAEVQLAPGNACSRLFPFQYRVPCNALALNLFCSECSGPSPPLMNIKSKQYLWKKIWFYMCQCPKLCCNTRVIKWMAQFPTISVLFCIICWGTKYAGLKHNSKEKSLPNESSLMKSSPIPLF